MKTVIKILIEPKDTAMCSDKRKLSEECVTCLSDIQESVQKVLTDITEKDDKQRSKMSEEWTMFLSDAQTTLNNSVAHSEKESEKVNNNSKWILTIVLGITFCIGAGFGVLYGKVSEMKYLKANRAEVLLKSEAQYIHALDKAYNDATFVRADGSPIDSTTYNLHIKAAYSGALRGSE